MRHLGIGARIVTISAMAVGLGVATGCTSTRGYEGDRRPKGEVSTILRQTQTTTPSADPKIPLHSTWTVTAVDGKAWSNFSSEFEVLPGEHTFSLEWSHGDPRYVQYSFAEKTPRHFVTSAGRTYRPNGRVLAWDFNRGTANLVFFMEAVPSPAPSR